MKTSPDYRIKPLARLVYSNAFEFSIVGLILANAIVLAILTFDGVPAETANWLMGFDDIVIWVFVARAGAENYFFRETTVGVFQDWLERF